MHDMDFAALRERMVDNQIRPSEVTDHEVIGAFLAVPRERFVAPAERPFAYADRELPLPGSGARAMMAPVQLARLVQLLPRTPRSRIMVVASGSGYSVAIVAKLVGSVVAVEADERLVDFAADALRACAVDNWMPFVGAPEDGCAEHAPYDGILIDGAIEFLPAALVEQIAPGGVIAGIEREGRIGRAMLWERVGDGVAKWPQFGAWAPPLEGFERKREFVF